MALTAKDAAEVKKLTNGQPDESIDWLYWGKIAVGVIVAGVAIYFGAKYLSSESEVVHIDANNI
jgi:phenylalanine-4-hydroxylase